MALFHTTVLDNQIKALPTVDTASGSVATFDTDMTENLVEVKCQIVAQQSGSGTPSPSNPRPITTYSEMNVAHSSKNLFDVNAVKQIYADSVNQRYGIKFNIIGKFTINSFYNDSAYIYAKTYINGSWSDNLYIQRGSSSTITSQTVTIENEGDYFIVFDASGSDDLNDAKTKLADMQVEYGTTATTYEQPASHNIPFGQTVANGVLDVTTGKLRVTDNIVDLSTITWFSYDSGSKRWQATIPSMYNYPSRNGNLVAEKYVADITTTAGDEYTMFTVGGVIYIYYTDSTTPPTGQLVYKLATPYEIQLDSTQITALLNENNIWCDTGDTEVKFLLTVGKKIS